jgi:hypothetical protein
MSKEQWRWLQTGAVRDTESGFFDQEGDLQISPFLKKQSSPLRFDFSGNQCPWLAIFGERGRMKARTHRSHALSGSPLLEPHYRQVHHVPGGIEV